MNLVCLTKSMPPIPRFIVLSRKSKQFHGWYTSEKNMLPLCGYWRPKVSTSLETMFVPSCACKFEVRPKILPMQDCHQEPKSSTSDLWWHGIDSCKVSLLPFAYASTIVHMVFCMWNLSNQLICHDFSHDFDTCVHMVFCVWNPSNQLIVRLTLTPVSMVFCPFSLAENIALMHQL